MNFIGSAFSLNDTSIDPEADATLPPGLQDRVFNYQLNQATKFQYLESPVYVLADVVTKSDLKFAKRIEERLHAMGVLATDTPLDTGKIEANFKRELLFLSVPAQRRLIGLLFFWEEEIERWNHFEGHYQEAVDNDRAIIQAEMRKSPSNRIPDIDTAPAPRYDLPPEYI